MQMYGMHTHKKILLSDVLNFLLLVQSCTSK